VTLLLHAVVVHVADSLIFIYLFLIMNEIFGANEKSLLLTLNF